MHLTVKQIELLQIIAKGEDGHGKPLDLDQILNALSYVTSKESLQFSIRALINKRLIYKRGTEKRRGRMRQVIAATGEGRAIAGVSAPKDPTFVVDELTDELEGIIEQAEEISKF